MLKTELNSDKTKPISEYSSEDRYSCDTVYIINVVTLTDIIV